MKMISRRCFVKRSMGAAAVAGFPAIIPSSVLGANAPSNQLIAAAIGMGGQGYGNMRGMMGQPGVRMVAVCDVDRKRAEKAQAEVNRRYRNKDCRITKDFRDIAHDPSIDIIMQACPDHWHAITSIDCLRNGKDIYGEKPLTRYLKEGRALVDTCSRYGRIWQTGSWQRSKSNFHRACELVQNGRIGKILRVEVGLPTGRQGGEYGPNPIPEHLDWNRWCGPAPLMPYHESTCHWDWRWNLDYGGGQLLDWVGHHIDIAHWGMGKDNTGPVSVTPINVAYPHRGRWNAPMTYKCECTYADGMVFTVASKNQTKNGMGVTWTGSDGWLYVSRRQFRASNEAILRSPIGPNEKHLYKSTNHMQNFIDCVRSRKQTVTPAEYAHRSASVGHLCMIALELGRTIKWNPEKEEILGDPTASALLTRSNRAPWTA